MLPIKPDWTSVSLLGWGMMLVVLVFATGCSLESPTASTSDDSLDQANLIPSDASTPPQFLNSPSALAKIVKEEKDKEKKDKKKDDETDQGIGSTDQVSRYALSPSR